MKNINLIDLIRINKDSILDEIQEKESINLKDGKEKVKALLVTFTLSDAGKVINNRIYPPHGQRDHCSSWITPYPKPILVNHNQDNDPIGRFKEVVYQDTEQEALDYLGNLDSYLEVKRAFQSNQPKKIYAAMKKHHLLNDRKWPGLGKLTATARVTDPDAIQKFLDERYLTFSAGTTSDSYTCMLCNSDWMKGDICEHRPGSTSEDGDLAIFITGAFVGKEGSVANMPADSASQVSNLKFEDSDSDSVFGKNPQWMLTDSEENFILTDSSVSMIMEKNTHKFDKLLSDLQELQPNTAIRAIVNGLIGDEFFDALTGASHYETSWLIRIHDSLHHEYEYDLKYKDEGDESRIPLAVFHLHGVLHDLSNEKGFRDSLLNGILDKYDSNGKESETYMLKETKVEDTKTETILEDKKEEEKEEDGLQDEQKSEEITEDKEENKEIEVKDEQVADEVTESTGEVTEVVTEDKKEESVVADEVTESTDEVVDEDDFCDDKDVDWFMLDLALQGLIAEEFSDAKLSAESRKKLASSAFCGPERSFPVNDCKHYTAAKRLIGRYKGPGDKSKILACIERKGKKLGCSTEDNVDCKCEGKYEDLKRDYVEALKQNDSLKLQLLSVLDKVAIEHKKTFDVENDTQKLDLMLTWFDSIEMKETSNDDNENEMKDKDVTKEPIDMSIDNPSITGSEDKEDKKENSQTLEGLSKFDMNVLKKYKEFCDNESQEVADIYFRQVRRFVSKTFDPANMAKLIN